MEVLGVSEAKMRWNSVKKIVTRAYSVVLEGISKAGMLIFLSEKFGTF